MATQAVKKGGTIQVTGVYGARYNGFPLDKAEYGYDVFDTRTDGCIKVVLKPGMKQ